MACHRSRLPDHARADHAPVERANPGRDVPRPGAFCVVPEVDLAFALRVLIASAARQQMGDQKVGQLVGPGFQLAGRHALGAVSERGMIGLLVHGRFENLVQGLGSGRRARSEGVLAAAGGPMGSEGYTGSERPLRRLSSSIDLLPPLG